MAYIFLLNIYAYRSKDVKLHYIAAFDMQLFVFVMLSTIYKCLRWNDNFQYVYNYLIYILSNQLLFQLYTYFQIVNEIDKKAYTYIYIYTSFILRLKQLSQIAKFTIYFLSQLLRFYLLLKCIKF